MYQAHYTEGVEWLAALLAEAPAPTVARAWATGALGSLLWFAGGDPARAEAALRESVALSRALGAPEPLLDALRNLSNILRARYGQGSRAAVLAEALALSQALGDRWSEGIALYLQGFDARMGGDLARARALLATSRELLHATGDPFQECVSLLLACWTACLSGDYAGALALAGEMEQLHQAARLHYLNGAVLFVPGEMAWARGATAEAVAWGERLLALARERPSGVWVATASIILARALVTAGEVSQARALLAPNLAGLGDDFGPGVAHHWSGRAAWQAGERATALGHLGAALRRFRAFGEWLYAPDSLEALAAVLADGDAATAAVRLLAAADATRAAWGLPRPPVEQPGMDATLAAARAALGEAAFDAAWATGAGLTIQEATEGALALLAGLVGAEEAAP